VYVFSLGPAAWLMSRGFISMKGFALMSFPAHFLPGGFSEPLNGYINWWITSGRFAGFKFRRQHPAGIYCLDFYCPSARVSVELDGFQHGLPEQQQRDQTRTQFLAGQDIEELRFWNHQWRKNREGVLLEIWNALHRRTGCVKVLRKEQNHRFLPPDPARMIPAPPKT